VSDRPTVLTTLQALDLSNSQLLATTLGKGAAVILKESEAQSDDKLTSWVYEAALCRHPTKGEREIVREILGGTPTAQGVEDLLWMVIMLPEYQIIR
jgi:hypothetical protein